MKQREMVRRITRMIYRRVSYFNGWLIDETNAEKSCEEAAIAILRSFKRMSDRDREGIK